MEYSARYGGSYQPVVCPSSIVSLLFTCAVAAGHSSAGEPRSCATWTAPGCNSSANCGWCGPACDGCKAPVAQAFFFLSHSTRYAVSFPQPFPLTAYAARCGASAPQPVVCPSTIVSWRVTSAVVV